MDYSTLPPERRDNLDSLFERLEVAHSRKKNPEDFMVSSYELGTTWDAEGLAEKINRGLIGCFEKLQQIFPDGMVAGESDLMLVEHKSKLVGSVGRMKLKKCKVENLEFYHIVDKDGDLEILVGEPSLFQLALLHLDLDDE
jgi:hypothetical protein